LNNTVFSTLQAECYPIGPVIFMCPPFASTKTADMLNLEPNHHLWTQMAVNFSSVDPILYFTLCLVVFTNKFKYAIICTQQLQQTYLQFRNIRQRH